MLSAFSFSLQVSTDFIIYDYERALENAKEKDKLIFLVFTGELCKNAGTINYLIRNDDELKKYLNQKFITTLLFVDDVTPLDAPYTLEINNQKRKIRTMGHKWALLEEQKFNCNMQPMIYVLDKNGQQLVSGFHFKNNKIALLDYLKEY